LPGGSLAQLYELSHFVDEVANCAPNEHWLISASRLCAQGRRACGRHAAFGSAYQHIEPEKVGKRCAWWSRSFRGAATASKAEEYGLEMDSGDNVKDV